MHVPKSHSYELPDGTVIDLSAEMELHGDLVEEAWLFFETLLI
jgi:hypothetical protein